MEPFFRNIWTGGEIMGPGGCPRIVIFSQLEECEKNYRRYIVDIPRIIF